MKTYLILAAAVLLSTVSFAKGKDCKKGSDKDMETCLAGSRIKWAFAPPTDMTPEKMITGPDFKPKLSKLEKASGIVFCQYYFHEFSSPGSAKFLCAKTNSSGALLDNKGNVVPEAKNISTRPMNLTAVLNGQNVKVDEGILLDSNNKPLIKLNKANREELVKADELKVKYFIDREQIPETGVKRETLQLDFGGEAPVKLDNVFVGPADISVGRWNEVFTEVAATRLFWALGLPADVMIPIKKIVCFGCDSHAKDQKAPNMARTSIYQFPVLERKYEGAKLGEQFSFNKVTGRYYANYPLEVQHEYEALALSAQLIAYHHAIALQNRMVCADGQFDKEKNICNQPVAFIQDVGSSWGGPTEGDSRGVLSLYQKGKIFSNAGSCELFYPLGSERVKEMFAGPYLNDVSGEGVEKFKQRVAHLTPEIMKALFEVSRYGDMQPALRDAAPGVNIEEKRAHVINQWVESFMARINEIKATRCRRIPKSSGDNYGQSSNQKQVRQVAQAEAGHEEAASDKPKKVKSKDFKKHFKNLNSAERLSVISKARVLDESYDAEIISKMNIPEALAKTCGPQFKYEKIKTEKGKTTYKWPRVECTYHQDDGGLSGASAKFLCDFPDASKKDGFTTLKVKYSRVGTNPLRAEVIDSTLASNLTRMIGMYAETYCLAEVVCKNCPSQSPWDNGQSAQPPSDQTYTFPLTMIENPIKQYKVTNPGPGGRSMPQGVHWDELRNLEGGEMSKQMRIEREAWMLWVGVIQHWDADPHNQRLGCIEARVDSNNNPYCEKAILYTHDYGRSFYRNFQFTLWSMTQPLKEDGKGCSSNFGKMLFNGNPGPGLVQFPHISSEARDLLVERINRLSDTQLSDLYQLSKGEEYVDVGTSRFVKALRNKVSQMKEANCLPFASGQSALGK